MITAMIVAALTAPGVESSQDYFPLNPGATWEYAVNFETGLMRYRQVQKILPSTRIGDLVVMPMEVAIDGKPDSKAYYRIHDGFVNLAALEEDALLPSPIPVLPLDPKAGQRWEFSGTTMMLGGAAPISTKYRVLGFEDREVLGSTKRTVKIESDTQVGDGATAMKMRSTEHYAPGIGLVYRKQEVLSRGGGVATFTLVRFEPGSRN